MTYFKLSLMLCAVAIANQPEPHETESAHVVQTSTEHHGNEPAPAHEEPKPSHPHGDVAAEKRISGTPHSDSSSGEPVGQKPSPKSGAHGSKTKESKHRSHGTASEPIKPSRPKSVLCGLLPARKLTWNAKQGPLAFVGTVVVGPGTVLTLKAGTEVRIGAHDSCPDSGAASSNDRSVALIVRGGVLRIEGMPNKPVRFTPLAEGKGFLWDGIRIEKAGRDEDAWLRWLEIPRATKGVTVLAGAGRIEHAVIEGCGIGIASMMGASPTISHSVVSGSTISGIVSSRSATRMISSLIMDGPGDGIRFDGIGLSEIRSSCFWGMRGTEIVRGPTGSGSWKGDSQPDIFGNWHRDPVLRESEEHERLLAAAKDSLAKQPWWKPRRLPENPPGSGRWSLSPFSPLIDKGEPRFCSDLDGSKCDIGLWGGS